MRAACRVPANPSRQLPLRCVPRHAAVVSGREPSPQCSQVISGPRPPAFRTALRGVIPVSPHQDSRGFLRDTMPPLQASSICAGDRGTPVTYMPATAGERGGGPPSQGSSSNAAEHVGQVTRLIEPRDVAVAGAATPPPAPQPGACAALNDALFVQLPQASSPGAAAGASLSSTSTPPRRATRRLQPSQGGAEQRAKRVRAGLRCRPWHTPSTLLTREPCVPHRLRPTSFSTSSVLRQW